MKGVFGAVVAICVALAVIGFEIATGIELSQGARLLIVIPLSVLITLVLEGKR